MLDTTTLNHRARETRRAAVAWSAGGAYAPSPMIESADTAMDEDLRASVATRTFRNREAGAIFPTGMECNKITIAFGVDNIEAAKQALGALTGATA